MELDIIKDIFCPPHRKEPLKIGSVKSNLGHTDASAGLVSIVKSIDQCVIRRRQLSSPSYSLRQHGRFVERQLRHVTVVSPVDEATLDEQIVTSIALGQHLDGLLRHFYKRGFHGLVGQQVVRHVTGSEQTCKHVKFMCEIGNHISKNLKR